MKKIRALLVVTFAIVLTACGTTPQPMVNLDKNIFANPELKVGVTFSLPNEEATTHISGADCLLCYGVASALTSSLDKHLKTSVTTSELEDMQKLVLQELAERSASVKKVTMNKEDFKKLKKFKTKEKIGFAKKDFRPLKEKFDVDVLVVLDLSRHGAYRSFSSYVPNGDPLGHVAGLLYTVDLDTNGYVQYLQIDEKIQPQSEWDEPPTFPSVTTSYYQAVENAKEKIKNAI